MAGDRRLPRANYPVSSDDAEGMSRAVNILAANEERRHRAPRVDEFKLPDPGSPRWNGVEAKMNEIIRAYNALLGVDE